MNLELNLSKKLVMMTVVVSYASLVIVRSVLIFIIDI